MHRTAALVITFHPDAHALEGIRQLASHVGRVIVVDNSATPADQTRLTEVFGSEPNVITLILNPTNLGVAAALNCGMRQAEQWNAEWVLTMDQDSRVTYGMVTTLLTAYDALPESKRLRVGSLAPVLVSANCNCDEALAQTSNAPVQTSRDVSTAITSGNLVRLAAWQAVGGYDEKLFIDYVDHDFCFRLRLAGWSVLECAQARLSHAIGNSTLIRRFGRTVSINQHSPLRFYYIARNGFYFWRTYRGPDTFLREDKINTLKLVLKALVFDTHKRERLLMFWRGYRDYRANRFGSYPAHNN